MVTSATSLSRSGLSDWLIQRLSAIILAAYTFCIAGVFVVNPEMDFEQWRGLFENSAMRLFSLITLLALCGHAWVGMWTVGTDYLTDRHLGGSGTALRLAYQALCVLFIVIYLFWGIRIFWGI